MTTEVMPQPQLSKGRLLLLGVSSVILCVSFIMSIFAPFPIALAYILYGRALGFLTSLLGLAISFAFASFIYQDLTLFWFYVGVVIFGFAISEIVQRGFSPVKGMVAFGLSFIAVFLISTTLYIQSQGVTVEKYMIQQIEKSADKISEQKKVIEQSADQDSIQVLQLLDRPDLMAKEIKESFPSYFFMGVFLMLWFNMFMVLKSRRLLLSANDYAYSEKNLLNFKVPFGFVIVLIAALVGVLFAKDMGYPQLELHSFTVIKCLGIFYFFQGFGVFSDLLSFLGVMGIFRSIIVMVVIFTGNYLIAGAGLFDNWFDFRKYFVKRKTEE